MSLETGRILIVRSPLRAVRLSLRRWRRLTLDLRDARIDARPARCLRGPNRHRRLRYLRVIKRAAADEHEVGPRFCFAEHRRPARRTERAVHHTSAVCNAAMVAEFAFDRNCTLAKAGVHRPASRAQVLAETTPADASHDRSCADPIAHRLAQASTGDLHVDSSRLQTPPECHSATAAGLYTQADHILLGLALSRQGRLVRPRSGPGRSRTAPAFESDSRTESATRATGRALERTDGVSEGTRTPDLQGHNLAL